MSGSLREAEGIWLFRRVSWIVLAWLIVVTATDADLWGHVRFGLDFIHTWTLPSVDPYSYKQDVPWINHEWLSEALMAAAYTAGRTTGLVLLKASFVALAYALVIRAYRRARQQTPWTPEYLGELLALVTAIFCASLTMTVRPQIWSFAGMALLIALLYGQPDARWRVVAVPLIFAAWANLHGGWVVGLALTGVWSAGELLRRRRWSIEPIAIASGSVLATLVNPYGWRLWVFIASTVRLSRADITEWHPIWSASWITVGGWLFAVAVLAVCTVAAKARPRADVIVTLAGLGFAAQRVQRLVSFLVLCTVMMLAPSISSLWPRRASVVRRNATSERAAAAKYRLNLALVGIVAAFATWAAVPHLRCIPQVTYRADPTAAAALIAPDVRGRLAIEFDWGEYAIWHLGPRLRVSMDGRRETIYSQARLREWAELAEGSERGLAGITNDEPEYVWMRAGRLTLKQGLIARGYRIDIDTPDSFVAVRSDLPPLMPVSPRSSGCFPEL